MKEKFKPLLSQISIIIPLLLISCYSASTEAMAPILNNISQAFPEASLTLVQMTVTLPSAISIPVQLLTVALAQYMTKKRMMVIAAVFVCFGGLLPLLIHSHIIILVVSAVFIGIGQGFFMPASNAIIGELFDGNMRGMFMGIKTGVSGFMRAGLSLLVGIMGAVYWYRAYLIFVIMIPFIVLFIWKTPEGKKGEKLVGKGVGLAGIKSVLTPAFITLTALAFCATLSQMAYLVNISGFIADKGLGGSVVAGAATASFTMARLFVGIALGFILRVLKKHTLGIGYFLCAIGYIIILGASGIAGVQIGGIVFGIGLGIQMAAGMYYMTEAVKKEYLSQAFGLYMPFISFAVSFSPIVINTLSNVMFGSVNAVNNFKIGMYGYIFTAVAMTVYQVFFCKDSQIGKISGLETAPAEEKEA